MKVLFALIIGVLIGCSSSRKPTKSELITVSLERRSGDSFYVKMELLIGGGHCLEVVQESSSSPILITPIYHSILLGPNKNCNLGFQSNDSALEIDIPRNDSILVLIHGSELHLSPLKKIK